MGGDIQPQIHAQFVSAVVDGGADVASAVRRPTLGIVEPEGHLAPPTFVFAVESRDAPVVIDAPGCTHRHDVHVTGCPSTPAFGHEHAIELVSKAAPRRPEGALAAATDPRSAGLPAVR